MSKIINATRDVICIAMFLAAAVICSALYNDHLDSNHQDLMRTRIQTLGKLVVPIKASKGQDIADIIGTGELVSLPSKQTAILTNAHVCKRANDNGMRVSTVIDGQRVYNLQIIKYQAIPDLCLYYSPVILMHPGLRIAPVKPFYGESLLEIGFPLNGPQRPSEGRYIGRNKQSLVAMTMAESAGCHGGLLILKGKLGTCVFTEDLENSTVTTFPGNSGSPVFNEAGQWVGTMNSAYNDTHDGNFVSGKHIVEFLKGL